MTESLLTRFLTFVGANPELVPSVVWLMDCVTPERTRCAVALGRLFRDEELDHIFVAVDTLRTLSNPFDSYESVLTTREKQVFVLIGIGRTTREIADELGVTLTTVNKHREHITQKLKIPGATMAVAAYEYCRYKKGFLNEERARFLKPEEKEIIRRLCLGHKPERIKQALQLKGAEYFQHCERINNRLTINRFTDLLSVLAREIGQVGKR